MKHLFRSLLVLLALAVTPAFAQTYYPAAPFYPSSLDALIAPATPAVHTVKSSAGFVTGIVCFNLLATPVYINLFNVASGSITLGTTSATVKLMCPGNTAGAGFVLPVPWPLNFTTAINYSVSSGISLTDNTSTTASSVIVDTFYN